MPAIPPDKGAILIPFQCSDSCSNPPPEFSNPIAAETKTTFNANAAPEASQRAVTYRLAHLTD